MTSSIADNFRTEIEAFLSRTGMSPSAFGKAAVNDPNFVIDVRDGRMPSLRMADRVRIFMQQQESGMAS